MLHENNKKHSMSKFKMI